MRLIDFSSLESMMDFFDLNLLSSVHQPPALTRFFHFSSMELLMEKKIANQFEFAIITFTKHICLSTFLHMFTKCCSGGGGGHNDRPGVVCLRRLQDQGRVHGLRYVPQVHPKPLDPPKPTHPESTLNPKP